MDEHGMENEHLEHKNSSNTEYLPTKCRVTKPPPPKPATNPLQFIKVAPPPLFQKAKEQISKVEQIKKETKKIQDEAEDWQANLDNWKSSRRKLQEHIIERVVEVKKFEQGEDGRTRRKSKTFNEILEERGKSKYSIPIYIDETNDWNDYGISGLKGEKNQDNKTGGHNHSESTDQNSSDEFPCVKNNVGNAAITHRSSLPKLDVKYNNNDYNAYSLHKQVESKASEPINTHNGQYTYEGAIESYRSRIKSKIDDSLLVKISDMPKHNIDVASIVPKGEIVKRKELFDRQLTEDYNVPNSATRVLQDFENSISIKQRLKSLEKCSDQTVKYVGNINVIPKVKQISQLFDKPCTDKVKNNYNIEVSHNNNTEYSQRREKLNINIVPWRERENTSESSDIYLYMDKNNLKETESQSDDKSSDTFYSGLDDAAYPPSISSTDYMALSSDREDSGIHTADVSCSVSQADDTAEELESNTNSNETANDDFHVRQKYYKDSEDTSNLFNNDMLIEQRDNMTIQTNTENCLGSGLSNFYCSRDDIYKTSEFLEKIREDTSRDMESTITVEGSSDSHDSFEDSRSFHHSPEIKEHILKSTETTTNFIKDNTSLGHLNISDPFSTDITSRDYMFDLDFPFLSTRLVEPPKVKPPPPPVIEDEKSVNTNVNRMNSTRRIKNEITLKRSSFLGLNEPKTVDMESVNYIAVSKEKQSEVEEILAKQLYESKIDNCKNSESIDLDMEILKDKEAEVQPETVKTETLLQEKSSTSTEEDDIAKREREIIEMVEKAEKFRDSDGTEEKPPIIVQRQAVVLTKGMPAKRTIDKPADASYYDKRPDYLDDQDSEVLKVEQELQQLEQEELKRKRDNLLFRQACSRVFAKNKRYSLENIFSNPSLALESRKSMPELQCLKAEKEPALKCADMFRSMRDVDLKYRKSAPNIPEYLYPGYDQFVRNDFQTIEKYERKSVPEFRHDIRRSAFEVPARKPSYDSVSIPSKQLINNIYKQNREPLAHNEALIFAPIGGEPSSFAKPRNRNALNGSWLKTRPNIETKSYDQHWLYQEAELRRLQDQKKFTGWQQPNHLPESTIPNFIQRGPITPSHGSSKSSIRKLSSINGDVQNYLEHHPTIGPPLPPTQPRSVAIEEGQNKILSVSGKKKCSFCDNELGRGAAMIIETLCLFYHMECFKCCVCHVQLGNGLNGTDVRVRNQKLHCHNCYSSDDGVKFSCV